VFVDSDNGVMLDDCSRLSRVIELALDSDGALPDDYMLEVSSPGLDRPLQTCKDFRRRVGESIRIFFDDASRKPMEGELVGADDTSIELLIDDTSQKIDLAGVRMGKILF
jgi:ribosome maturation factor RimP